MPTATAREYAAMYRFVEIGMLAIPGRGMTPVSGWLSAGRLILLPCEAMVSKN